jgi:hypothetical protein
MLLSMANAKSLECEIDWFSRVMEARIRGYFEQSAESDDIYAITPPDLSTEVAEYARVVNEHDMGFAERIVFILALIPHVRPQLLDTLFIRNKNLDRGYTEFGGWKGNNQAITMVVSCRPVKPRPLSSLATTWPNASS